MIHYKIKLGKRVSVGGPIKISGNPKNIIIKGSVGINAFCVLGCRDDAKIIIGNNVRISACSVIIPYGLEINVLDKKRNHIGYGDIVIEDNVWVGSNSTVVGSVKIGKNSVIAAGSVVTKNVPSNCVVAGVPAKIVKHLK